MARCSPHVPPYVKPCPHLCAYSLSGACPATATYVVKGVSGGVVGVGGVASIKVGGSPASGAMLAALVTGVDSAV